MLSVKLFKECLARPQSLLKDHLINVRVSVESFFQNYDDELARLIGLSGISHDLAKSNTEWQKYIIDDRIKRGPNHSACGAFFFSYLGYHMLQEKDIWNKYCVHWLWLIRDIADHHGKLAHLSEDRWLKDYSWDKYDLAGIQDFIHEQYCELKEIPINAEVLKDWIDEGEEAVEEVLDLLYIGYDIWDPLELMNELQKWRMLTTSLIAGDRFDVKNVETTWIDKEQHIEHLNNIIKFCGANQYHPLSKLRMEAQTSIMKQLEKKPNQTFYTLDMPTGMGKTLTSPDYGLMEFANATWVMALNGSAWLLFTGLFSHKVEGITKKVSGGDPKRVGILMISAMCGAFAYLFGNELFKAFDPETRPFAISGLTAAVSMLILERIAKKYPKLGEYNLGIAMVIGMACTVIFNRIVA